MRIPKFFKDPKQVEKELDKVSHKKFQESRHNYWIVDSEGKVKLSSVCWLYCWGKTEGESWKNAAAQSREVFNSLFDISFEQFDSYPEVSREWAQKMRYLVSKSGYQADQC